MYERAGGYYLGSYLRSAFSLASLTWTEDTGASQQIIDGKIKVRSGGEIERFTENGLQFCDGSELEADVVIFATGYAPEFAGITSRLNIVLISDLVTPETLPKGFVESKCMLNWDQSGGSLTRANLVECGGSVDRRIYGLPPVCAAAWRLAHVDAAYETFPNN